MSVINTNGSFRGKVTTKFHQSTRYLSDIKKCQNRWFCLVNCSLVTQYSITVPVHHLLSFKSLPQSKLTLFSNGPLGTIFKEITKKYGRFYSEINAFENSVCKLAAILFMSQLPLCVNWLWKVKRHSCRKSLSLCYCHKYKRNDLLISRYIDCL